MKSVLPRSTTTKGRPPSMTSVTTVVSCRAETMLRRPVGVTTLTCVPCSLTAMSIMRPPWPA